MVSLSTCHVELVALNSSLLTVIGFENVVYYTSIICILFSSGLHPKIHAYVMCLVLQLSLKWPELVSIAPNWMCLLISTSMLSQRGLTAHCLCRNHRKQFTNWFLIVCLINCYDVKRSADLRSLITSVIKLDSTLR